MNALIIGRFQPFHKGHQQLIHTLCREYTSIIIGVGSSQYSFTKDNPFSYNERTRMIRASICQQKCPQLQIIPIPDIHDYDHWVDHVLSITDDFDVVISNNPLTKSLFSKKGIPVKSTPLFQKDIWSGTVIREKIQKGQPWEHLVSEPTVDIIKNLNGVNRIQHLL